MVTEEQPRPGLKLIDLGAVSRINSSDTFTAHRVSRHPKSYARARPSPATSTRSDALWPR